VNRAGLLDFLRRNRLCVQATASGSGEPQAAVVGFGVSDDLEVVFDTLDTTRKVANLRERPQVALVVGWDEGQTAQIRGVADEPTGAEFERLKRVYFAAYPDGPERLSWKGITYVRVRPTWVRFSDFRPGNQRIVEFSQAELWPRSFASSR
jgi:uncharacterized pyridoxamine 5'-phosphate oxidase family protein